MQQPISPSPPPTVESSQKSDWACSYCRKLHRRCDRMLPSCSHCLKQKVSCEYHKPSDRRKKSNHFEIVFATSEQKKISKNDDGHSGLRYEPYKKNSMLHVDSAHVQALQHELNYRFVTSKTLDAYFQIICCGIPLVERNRLEQLTDYQTSLVHPSFTNSSNDGLFESNYDFEKEQSMMFMLQALCLQQMGYSDMASLLFSNGRQIIGKYFDDIDCFSIMTAKFFMSLYLLGEGEKGKATVMISNVRSCLQPYLKDGTNQQQLDFSNQKYFSAFIIESQLKQVDLYLCEEFNPTTFIFTQLETISRSKLSFDEGISSKGCKNMDKSMVEELISIYNAFESVRSIITGANYTFPFVDSLISLYIELIMKRINLDILLNANEEIQNEYLPELLKVANDVISLTKNSSYFTFLPVLGTRPIIQASTIRMVYFAMLDKEQNLTDDLKALKSLANRFKSVKIECEGLIKSIETLCCFQNYTQDVFDIPSIQQPNLANGIVNSPTESSPNHSWIDIETIYEKFKSFHRNAISKSFKREGSDFIEKVVDNFFNQHVIRNDIFTHDESKQESIKEYNSQLVKLFEDLNVKTETRIEVEIIKSLVVNKDHHA